MLSHQTSNSKKFISVSTVASSFVGVMAAVPIVFALNASISASALPASGQAATSQVNTEDFAKFAYAFNQGYEASATSASTSSGGGGQPASCSEATVSAGSGGGGSQASTVQMNMYSKPMVGGKGGGAHYYSNAKMPNVSKRAMSMMNSYNTYSSMVNNSSTVNNVNSNNTVGSHNSTETKIKVDDSKGVIVGVSNDSTSVQNNASESFNEDSYNTKNETSIVNDSFNKEVNNTTSTDIDVNKETHVNNETNISNTEGSHNTSNNQSNNSMDVDVKANVDVNSHNDTTMIAPVINEEPPVVPLAQEEPVVLPEGV